MSEQIKKKKNLNRQLTKMISKMNDRAIKELSKRSAATRGRSVHNARKQLKRLRGLLRLLRHAIGERTYKRENLEFRNAGRPLSTVRDADVMIETLNNLIEHYKKQVRKSAFQDLQRTLIKRRRTIRKEVLEKEGAMSKVARSLRKATGRIKKWPRIPDRFQPLARGLRDVYKNGKQEMEIVLENSTPENLHQWRKSVKYLRYQLEIFEAAWPPVIGEMAQQARLLSDVLGLDHDLVVLKELVQGECSDCCKPTDTELLFGLIHQRRVELQKEAFEIGSKLYTETPKQFSRRMKGYWKSWQEQRKAAA